MEILKEIIVTKVEDTEKCLGKQSLFYFCLKNLSEIFKSTRDRKSEETSMGLPTGKK